ncbi:MAG: xanthine dehydrogenase family protein molybdopterin-binding subunit [Chloroflexi bacterium]|nr:xanthine dehydrogenase family protein molybdopterin-binding subunit [Chloroflexota bacterium]MCL5074301.1 xanthine dehydrogenase family protein molybdopterin-binding subunit [Chloroflexota bacterium]
MTDLEVVGYPVRRIDALEKVTGAAKFGGDIYLPGMLFARTLRSPFPHARVLSIDTSKVANLWGVEAVVTAADIRGINRHGLAIADQPVLVAIGEKARRVGDPIALVAARSAEIAQRAIELIEMEYQELEVIAEPEIALQPGAMLVHEDKGGNICSEYHFNKGDIVRGFAQADVVIEETYRWPRQEHAFLEPESGVATINARGELTVYTGCSDPVYIRAAIAKALGWPQSKIEVIAITAGGHFGGRSDVSLQIHLALLALKTGQPVKMVWTREESTLMHVKRHPVRLKYKMGTTKEGKLTAIEVDVVADAGAYASASPYVLQVMCSSFPGPYDMPHIKVDGLAVYTNNPVSGAMRGYGEPQAITATESQMEAVAQRLEIDPVQFRLQNALQEGAIPGVPGVVLDGEVSLGKTMEMALTVAGPRPEPSAPQKKVGRGISVAMPTWDISGKPMGPMTGSGASVEVLPDGTALVRVGVGEIGTGITTVVAQIVAEELGIPLDSIAVITGSTAATLKAGPQVGSRSAYVLGNAVKMAADKVKAILCEKATEKLEMTPDMLQVKKGRIFAEERPDWGLPVAEVAQAAYLEGTCLVANAWFKASHAISGHTFITAIADVEVDEETGETNILKLVNVHDSGKALNPANVEGQLFGGAVQGLGYVLMEDMPTKDGFILNLTLTEYLIPTATDIPTKSAAVIIECPYPTGPYGAKGVGEHSTDATPAAILNAIYDAIGIRITKPPATPQRILQTRRAREMNGVRSVSWKCREEVEASS